MDQRKTIINELDASVLSADELVEMVDTEKLAEGFEPAGLVAALRRADVRAALVRSTILDIEIKSFRKACEAAGVKVVLGGTVGKVQAYYHPAVCGYRLAGWEESCKHT